MLKKILNIFVIAILFFMVFIPNSKIASAATTGISVIEATTNSIKLHIDLSDYPYSENIQLVQDNVTIYSSTYTPVVFDYTVNDLSPGVTYNFKVYGDDISIYNNSFSYSTTGTTTIYDDINQPPYDETALPPDGVAPSYPILDTDLMSTQTNICTQSGGDYTTLSLSSQLTTTQLNQLILNPDAYQCPFGKGGTTTTSSTPKINELISIISYSRNSNGEIAITYKIKKSYSTNEYITIGYNWPTEYRGALPNYYKTASRSSGTYTLIIPRPSAYVGNLILKIKYGAGGGRYSESKTFGHVFHAPSGKKVTYHTVTKAEQAGDFFTYYAVPGAFFQFSPAGKYVKIISTTYLGWSLYDNWTARTDYSSGFPHPAEGQYYRITNWYNNFNLYTKTEVWDSKEEYKKGVTPGTYLTYYGF